MLGGGGVRLKCKDISWGNVLNHQVVFCYWRIIFFIHTLGMVRLQFFLVESLMCASIFIKLQGILMVTRLFLQKTMKPPMHFTLPTAFVHHPPGYSLLTKRGGERPSCVVCAGSSVRVKAWDSTPKGHCFYHPWHFHRCALVQGSEVDFSAESTHCWFPSHLSRDPYSMTLKRDLIPTSLLPSLSQMMAQDNSSCFA